MRHKYITRAAGPCNQDFKFKPSEHSSQRWLDEWRVGREERPGAVNFLNPPWYKRKHGGVPQFDKGGFGPALSTWGGKCGSGVNPDMPKNYRGKSYEQLLQAAEKASTLEAAKRAWGDTRWHGKMHEKKGKQPPNVYPHRERAHDRYYRDASPFLVSEADLAARYGFASAQDFADWCETVKFPKPDGRGVWRPGPVLQWESKRRCAPPKVPTSSIESPCVLPNDEHGGNTGASFFLAWPKGQYNALHPKTAKAAKAAERARKKAAKPAQLRLSPDQWDDHAIRAQGGDQRALKTLREAAFVFATRLATPFCRRDTSLSAEALAVEALYPLSKKTGAPIFGLMGSLDSWKPDGGRAFVWYLREMIERNVKKSLRGGTPTLSLNKKIATYYDGINSQAASYIELVADGDGIFDGDGFDVESALAVFDELEGDLTDTERRVLTCHRNGDTDKKIGDGLSVSRERARQIRISAVNKLTR